MAAPRIEKLNNIGFAWYRNKVRALNDTQSEDEIPSEDEMTRRIDTV